MSDTTHIFYPQEDITAYELALIVKAMGVRTGPGAVEYQPPEVQRHFAKIVPRNEQPEGTLSSLLVRLRGVREGRSS